MTGLFGTLEIGKSALMTQQLALTVVGQNIANVNTPGYTRQRADLVSKFPLVTPNLILGRGVNVAGINHLRNEFIEDQLIAQLSTQGKYTVQEDAFSQLEVIFNEPSEFSINGLFDNFWSAWQDLSINPESFATRMIVRESSASLVNKITELYELTSDYQVSLNDSITKKVAEINTLTEAIHNNNQLIIQL
jgi:flagellar hook-associated protein 1